MDAKDSKAASKPVRRHHGLSYKFQRLREKIRSAIDLGELAGKLPGERALAKQFHCNAKTLSKALTDLAAEGVLDRSIGRGTYVKGSAPAVSASGRWLLLCDSEDSGKGVIDALRIANPDLQTITLAGDMRPSFLNQFCAVIDVASQTPDTFLRDLVVRGMPVVAVNRELKTYSMPAVIIDTALCVSRLGRDLLLAGHRRLAAVEPPGTTSIAFGLRQAAARYVPESVIDSCSPAEIGTLIEHGVTGIVCGSTRAAQQVRAQLERLKLQVPERISLTAIGCLEAEAPCSGYYCTCRQIADAVVELLKAPTGRPSVIWLAGDFQDRGTIGPTGSPSPFEELANVRVNGIVV